MRANELLLWLSARRDGSWQQFRAAVEELHSCCNEAEEGPRTSDDGEFPVHQQLRLDLERLAHVEFFARGCDEGWRVAPPTLATHPVIGSSGVRAILCGARSPSLMDRLLDAGQDLDHEIQAVPGAPDVVRLRAGDAGVLADVATRVRLQFQLDAPLAILSQLPPCDPPLRKTKPSEFPVGADWIIHEFDSSSLGWRKVDRSRALAATTGLFRWHIYFQRDRFFLRWFRATFEVPRAIGLYALLRKRARDVVHYDASARTFIVPGVCRPPGMLERALVLCSGLPPSFDPATARLTYSDVSPEAARFAAQLLRQPLA